LEPPAPMAKWTSPGLTCQQMVTTTYFTGFEFGRQDRPKLELSADSAQLMRSAGARSSSPDLTRLHCSNRWGGLQARLGLALIRCSWVISFPSTKLCGGLSLPSFIVWYPL
jgi:hypothetical protein